MSQLFLLLFQPLSELFVFASRLKRSHDSKGFLCHDCINAPQLGPCTFAPASQAARSRGLFCCVLLILMQAALPVQPTLCLLSCKLQGWPPSQ